MPAASTPPPRPVGAESAPSAPRAGASRLVWVKVAITLALMAFLSTKLDLAGLDDKLQSASVSLIVLAIIIVSAEVPIVALRWRLIARRTGSEMSLKLALQLTWAGLFFGQVLPASIGGDVVRGVLAARNGLTWQTVVSSLVVDRLIALLAAVVLIAASLPFLQADADAALRLTAMISMIAVLALPVGLFVDRLPLPDSLRRHPLVSQGLHLMARMRQALFSRAGFMAMALSLLVHAMTIVAVVALANSLGFSDVWVACAIVTPIALVAAAVPISVNGWGVREGVMVAGFALFGIAQPDAFLVSVFLGLAVVVSALPGGWSWLILR